MLLQKKILLQNPTLQYQHQLTFASFVRFLYFLITFFDQQPPPLNKKKDWYNTLTNFQKWLLQKF